MSKIMFGWAEVDITPTKKASLAGQFAERISEYVEKPLYATAFAIKSEEEQCVFVSCDLISTPANLVDEVRKNLQGNAYGIDPMKVIVNAIHTHTGPLIKRLRRTTLPLMQHSAKSLLQSLLPPDKKYVERQNVSDNPDISKPEETFAFLVEKITAVIIEAFLKVQEGYFITGFGRAAVGMCRRASYSDGSAQMWGNTDTATFTALEGGNDSGIELMYVYNKDKKLTGIIANLACPAQCVQHRLFVSPDFWGEVKVLLRKEFGDDLFLLAQCSAAGDQCPVDLIRWVEPESPVNDPNIEREDPLKRKADPSMFDLRGMKRVGKRIADEIKEVFYHYLDEDFCNDVEFVHETTVMKLPLRRVTMKEEAEAKKAIKEYLDAKIGDVDYNDAAKLQIHTGVLRRFKLQDIQNVLDTEVHVVKLGDIVFATNPFELFLDYGNQIKARSRAQQTFIVQLANGQEGYLPTEKAEKGGHYSAFVSSGQVGHEGREQLVRQTLEIINNTLFRDIKSIKE
ncbi:MAG: hypothetical protein J6B56_05785 [Clostridia bacterium]|nr:hypothetical protein [Clostridia bacterium]